MNALLNHLTRLWQKVRYNMGFGLFERNNIYDDDGSLKTTQNASNTRWPGENHTFWWDEGHLNGSTSTTIYTVPAGKILYVAQYVAYIGEGSGNGGVGSLYVGTTGIRISVPFSSGVGTYDRWHQFSANLSIPLKATVGQTVRITQNESANTFGVSLQGWLENA